MFAQSTSFRPHACGVDSITRRHGCRLTFQTPRLWGRFQAHPPHRVGVHFRPHACGEDGHRSPDLRGQEVSDPTRVGKIFSLGKAFAGVCFRPHACGEDDETDPELMYQDFQTPRVWGRSPQVQSQIVPQLSDPTRVGKIASEVFNKTGVVFRPHACGEDAYWQEVIHQQDFQTPRVWGRCELPSLQECKRLSDPTPVGWMTWTERCDVWRCFRPHACGVDKG